MPKNVSPVLAGILALLVVAVGVGGWLAYSNYDKHRERDTSGFVDRIESWLGDNESTKGFGEPSADCPSKADQAPGESFECLVSWPTSPEAGQVTVRVTIQNSDGEYLLKVTG